jgi:hypothetical protein
MTTNDNCIHVTLDLLIQLKSYPDYMKAEVLGKVCSQRKLTDEYFDWLLDYFGEDLIQTYNDSTCPLIELLDINKPTLFIKGIAHIIKITKNQNLLNMREPIFLSHRIFKHRCLTDKLITQLFELDPNLDVYARNDIGDTPLGLAIIESSKFYDDKYDYSDSNLPEWQIKNLFRIFQTINSHYSDNLLRTIPIPEEFFKKRRLRKSVLMIAQHPYQLTIHMLIRLCGELFQFITHGLLTQTICNQFYSSKYFQQDKLYLLDQIPVCFHSNLKIQPCPTISVSTNICFHQ